MSPTKAIGNVALALVVASAGYGGYVAWKRYGRLNPYASLENGAKRPSNPETSIQATGVKVRHYENGKLMASAEADGMTVNRERNGINLTGIRNGVAETARGPMKFAAKKGVLRPNLRMVDVSGGVRVQGKDFDIQTTVANINGRKGELTAPEPLKGRIMGGDFVAASLVHQPGKDFTRLMKPDWTGKLTQVQGLPPTAKDRTWHFTGDEVTKQGTVESAKNAWASDEQMVITAPLITQSSKNKVVTATGNGKVRVTYHSAKADIVADKVVIFRDERKAVCTGHVLVYVRPKKEWDKPISFNEEDRGPLVPDVPMALAVSLGQGKTLTQAEKDRISELRSSKNLRDYPMQMAAEEVTYWYKEGERRAIAKGGTPTAFQKFDDGRWRQIWAPEAHYDGEKNMLDLIGSGSKRDVHLKNSIEDVNDCFQAKLSTKEDQTEDDEYVYMKNPKGRVIDFDDDKPKAGDPKPGEPKPADPKATPPPAKTEP